MIADEQKKARAFCFTVIGSDYESRFDVIFQYLKSMKSCDYILAGREIAPSTGSPHFQCYVHFKNCVRIKKDIYKLAKFFPAHGSSADNYKYCTKEDDNPIEWGKRPKDVVIKTVKDLDDASESDVEGLGVQYYNIVEKWRANKANERTIDDFGRKPCLVWYLYGPSGFGKSEIAECLAKKMMELYKYDKWNELKFVNNFWMGVSKGCKVAIYDEWRDSHMKASEFINFIDYKKHVLNIKNGSLRNMYEFIFITSTQSPMEIYKNVCADSDEPRKQWLRRMICYEFQREYEEAEYDDLIDEILQLDPGNYLNN